ncbi:MAG TPA: hypothetical protein VFC25_16110 [Verrucomicrobiae bacterium]|nr:hypothetical protein [Verrucomicrobiae bacterium]
MRPKAVVLACLVAVSSWVLAADLPAGWIKAGSAPADYDMGVDSVVRHAGAASGTIHAKSAETDPKNFGTLMQMGDPGEYRGKRVRLSGYVRSDKVEGGWAGLWFRVDGPQRSPLAFDNMQDRAIKGTTDWTKVAIVLDVPQEATAIAYGILLSGPGQVWMDDLKFEVVTSDVPVTGQGRPSGGKPQNLDFEE